MSIILPALKTSKLQYEKITKATKTEEMRATDLEEAKTLTDFLIFCVAVRELAFLVRKCDYRMSPARTVGKSSRSSVFFWAIDRDMHWYADADEQELIPTGICCRGH